MAYLTRTPILFAALLVGTAALATEPLTDGPVSDDHMSTEEPPERSDYMPQTLDDYFAVLAAAPNQAAAKATESRIWQLWNQSGSDSVDLLMQRARAAMSKKTYPLALQLLDAVIELDPDYAEGWNRRATVHFLMKNYGESLGDIQRTLALEPRHFGAISGMAMIFQRIGDDAAALEAYRRVLDIHPFLNDAERQIEKLEEDVEGRGI